MAALCDEQQTRVHNVRQDRRRPSIKGVPSPPAIASLLLLQGLDKDGLCLRTVAHYIKRIDRNATA
jgi:hypothetical protein